MELEQKHKISWLDKPLISVLPPLKLETLLIIIILVLAVFSRFTDLGLRVMSHDEVNHVVPSFDLYEGRAYHHDPVTHGPFQFHLVALSYFIFGDSDFSARIPAALFSVATVAAVLFCFRRYLGRIGSLAAGIFFLISPYMLFYGRYTRNEAFVGLFGVLMLYAVLRYLEKKDLFSMFLLTAVTALHYTTKETAYIYSAQLLIFLAFLFLTDILKKEWHKPDVRNLFTIFLVLAVILAGLSVGMGLWDKTITEQAAQTAPVTSLDAGLETPPEIPQAVQPVSLQKILMYGGLVLAGLFILAALFMIVKGLGWDIIRSFASFDLLIISLTLILPLLSAFPAKMVGWDPLDYSSAGMLRTAVFVVLFFLISFLIGIWWNSKVWLYNAALFYGIFIFFYTTFFTNGQGFFTGLVGSLGYWLSQQSVERGSQPLYYYALVQIPIYEYLAALGTLAAAFLAFRFRKWLIIPGFSHAGDDEIEADSTEEKEESVRLPVIPLLIFWSFTSLVAYSYAGEKMPWLTVHIALPMLLAAGWAVGFLIDRINFKKIFSRRFLVAAILVFLFIFSFSGMLGSLFGTTPPFQGNTLDQLNATSTFLLSFLVSVLSSGFALWMMKGWEVRQIFSIVALAVVVILGGLTARSAYMASFINYDTAKEYLVYAHAARGPKDILEQVEEISQRTTGGLDIQVAYDNDALYPYWWYFRNYPNHRWYTDTPTRDLADYPVIISGTSTFSKIEPIVKDNYVMFEYMRLWWPNQDYFNLTWERIKNAITDPAIRAGIFDIWLNRDYRMYAAATNNSSLTLETWTPSEKIHLYIRKDIIAEMWNYGTAPVLPETSFEDPYEGKYLELSPEFYFGFEGTEAGMFEEPHGLAFAPDGTFYVADSKNNRIQHFSTSGEYLGSWGTFGSIDNGTVQGGLFNEPWGIAVGSDGSVYVSDTWNHRIQKFTANGQFVTMWGYFGQGETPDAFYGPRGLAVDEDGRVYVADTGNKRIVVFTSNGEFVTQFGTYGFDVGEFDEPVAVALDANGNVYVTDTWNQRIQVFSPDETGTYYYPLRNWEVSAWYGTSLENKPFIAIDPAGYVYITDPESYRVLEFDLEGNPINIWGDYSASFDGFGLPSGIAVDNYGRVWVSDAGNHTILQFSPPTILTE